MNERYFNRYTNEELNKYRSKEFEDIRRELFHLPPVRTHSMNEKKYSRKKNKFLNGHTCNVCGGQLYLIEDTNIMQCEHCGHNMLLKERKTLIAQSLLQQK